MYFYEQSLSTCVPAVLPLLKREIMLFALPFTFGTFVETKSEKKHKYSIINTARYWKIQNHFHPRGNINNDTGQSRITPKIVTLPGSSLLTMEGRSDHKTSNRLLPTRGIKNMLPPSVFLLLSKSFSRKPILLYKLVTAQAKAPCAFVTPCRDDAA